MNILLIGSGGREHALAVKISTSPLCSQLFIAPGNAGTESCGMNFPIAVTDFPALKNLIIEKNIGFVIVGPEEPLVKGFREFLEADSLTKDILILGPGLAGAELEGSKDFAKAFMLRHGIPTAAYRTFTKDSLDDAYVFLDSLKAPYVLKADGLAAGKGVIISSDLRDAKNELAKLLRDRSFGTASDKVVIEEFLDGIELSVFALTDGKNFIMLPEAKDYKRIGDGDKGLNTGGMGAVSPVPFADAEFMKKVEERIIRPTIEGFQKELIDYRGFVFIGLMNVNGDPFVIEYNVRMGDPETEVVVPRIQSDLLDYMLSAARGDLKKQKLEIDPRYALTVMLVSGGYPEAYETGKEIYGTEMVNVSKVYHAGTSKEDGGKLLTNGGRILAMTAISGSIQDARLIVYRDIKNISFEKMNFRTDIGTDLLA